MLVYGELYMSRIELVLVLFKNSVHCYVGIISLLIATASEQTILRVRCGANTCRKQRKLCDRYNHIFFWWNMMQVMLFSMQIEPCLLHAVVVTFTKHVCVAHPEAKVQWICTRS